MLLIRSAADSWDSTVTLHSVFNDSLTCISKVNISSIYLCRQVTRHEQLSMFMVTFAAMSYNTSYAPNIGGTFSKKRVGLQETYTRKLKKRIIRKVYGFRYGKTLWIVSAWAVLAQGRFGMDPMEVVTVIKEDDARASMPQSVQHTGYV